MTSPTTKRFQWIDRDTAARDLLQLVYHAPEEIRRHALKLLRAIRSPTIIPELQEIFRDSQYDSFEREDALYAIINTPGDVYMPELRFHLDIPNRYNSGIEFSAIHQVFELADHHPSNYGWLFEYIDQLAPNDLHDLICIVHFPESEEKRNALYDRLIALLETHPRLFDLNTVRVLRGDRRESTIEWLAARWQTLVYICLTTPIDDLVSFLKYWEELRNVVFFTCPAIVLEYHPVRAARRAADERYSRRRERQRPTKDFMQSQVWQEREQPYLKATEGNEKAAYLLEHLTRNGDVLERAVAVYFFGKLPNYPHFIFRLLSFLRFERVPWIRPKKQGRYSIIYYPISYEAIEILRAYPSPEVWEALINAYFSVHGPHPMLRDWIAYQTDILSGVEVKPPWNERQLEYTPWFQALLESTDT